VFICDKKNKIFFRMMIYLALLDMLHPKKMEVEYVFFENKKNRPARCEDGF
jgi:hypothetical protein